MHALEMLNALSSEKCLTLVVVDENNKLEGTITDGDIRRGILNGHHTNKPVSCIMNSSPITMNGDEVKNKASLELAQSNDLKLIPVVDKQGFLLDIISKEIDLSPSHTNSVVILAGGLGSRLKPYTDNCPKPLLNLNSKPILERIIENIRGQGFTDFHLAVNYKAEMLREHFGDGSKLGVDISYINEEKKLGTAGPLSLLGKPATDQPIIVLNGDLLTKVNLNNVVDFHLEHKSVATMCAKEYEHKVPFGVIDIHSDYSIKSIIEKPTYNFHVNAGIYVISPSLLEKIPKNEHYDMTSLFDAIIKENLKTSIYPLKEYWRDIGNLEDFELAKKEVHEEFDS